MSRVNGTSITTPCRGPRPPPPTSYFLPRATSPGLDSSCRKRFSSPRWRKLAAVSDPVRAKTGGSAVGDEAVADAGLRHDMPLRGGGGLQLLPQPPNVHVQRMRLGGVAGAPDSV